MSKTSLEVSINPAIMKWIRESAGIDVNAVANRVGTSINNVKRWESGESRPTLRVLNDLSVYYKRPLAVFFLPEPPYEPPLPQDFRFSSKAESKPLSKEVRLVVREARRIQRLTADLKKDLGIDIRSKLSKISLDDDPEEVARKERKRFRIDIQDQFNWTRGSIQAFRLWRRALEQMNVIVYQAPMNIEEVRGFSLNDDQVPIIVINSSDAPNGRVFTLFHEYAHLMLEKPGVCLPQESIDENNPAIERFCNHFAGAFLVPFEDLFAYFKPSINLFNDEIIKVANLFKVSKYVIWRRLLTYNQISRNDYIQRLEIWKDEYSKKPPKKNNYRPEPARQCVERKGTMFTSLVIRAKEAGVINSCDVADYLSIRLKHLDKVVSLVSF